MSRERDAVEDPPLATLAPSLLGFRVLFFALPMGSQDDTPAVHFAGEAPSRPEGHDCSGTAHGQKALAAQSVGRTSWGWPATRGGTARARLLQQPLLSLQSGPDNTGAAEPGSRGGPCQSSMLTETSRTAYKHCCACERRLPPGKACPPRRAHGPRWMLAGGFCRKEFPSRPRITASCAGLLVACARGCPPSSLARSLQSLQNRSDVRNGPCQGLA